MKKKNEKKTIDLSSPCDVHWRATFEGFEHMMRTIADKGVTFSDAERKKWFTAGWQRRLEEQRARHRKAGVADENFLHKKDPRRRR